MYLLLSNLQPTRGVIRPGSWAISQRGVTKSNTATHSRHACNSVATRLSRWAGNSEYGPSGSEARAARQMLAGAPHSRGKIKDRAKNYFVIARRGAPAMERIRRSSQRLSGVV